MRPSRAPMVPCFASTDCGFGTFAGSEMCAESVVWAKPHALREGADLATERVRAA